MNLTDLAIRSRRIARNAVIDLRYGGLLGGAFLRRRKSSNSDYEALSAIFAGRVEPDDVLVDVGCGGGRVLNWWIGHRPNQPAFGIEQDSEFAERTRRRLRRWPHVTVLHGDAIELLPVQGTLFYLFNPLPADALARFRDRLHRLASDMDPFRILYYNCKHVGVFEDDPAWSVERIDLNSGRRRLFDPFAVIELP